MADRNAAQAFRRERWAGGLADRLPAITLRPRYGIAMTLKWR